MDAILNLANQKNRKSGVFGWKLNFIDILTIVLLIVLPPLVVNIENVKIVKLQSQRVNPEFMGRGTTPSGDLQDDLPYSSSQLTG